MAERATWRRGQKADYTDRPLTEREKAFASDEENYNQLFKFMRRNRLDPEEWYDILIIPYLNAVKKYCSREELHIYPFCAISEKVLSCAYHHYWRSAHAQKRMPEGGFISLDYTLEGDNPFSEHNIEPFWIDPMQNVERYVVEKEFLNDIYSNIHRYAEPDLLKLIIDMRQEGYSNREIARKAVVVIENYQDWGIMEVAQLIAALTKTHNSALQRLYRDTEEYGNIDSYQKWEDAKGNW